jgi:hypothetical protein
MELLSDATERCSPIVFLASVVPMFVLAAATVGVAAIGQGQQGSFAGQKPLTLYRAGSFAAAYG